MNIRPPIGERKMNRTAGSRGRIARTTLIFPISSIMIESVNTEVSSDAVTRASIFAALADPGRLAIVDRLLLGDASPTEIQLLLSMPSNLVAHHVRLLEKAGVVREVRSEGDRRRKYLCVDTDALEAIVPSMARQAHRVVFVCTQNSRAVNWRQRSGIAAAPCPPHRQELTRRPRFIPGHWPWRGGATSRWSRARRAISMT